MKIALINKSDSTGGAAVVSRRLLDALRAQGHDARMLVAEKLSDNHWVFPVAPPARIRIPFYAERLRVALANGFDKNSLFRIDPASNGLPLHSHPWVREADAILLNWTNQGLLSLKGLARIAALGKPVVQTMHDMWPFTGICHHAHSCTRFTDRCGLCPLLGRKASPADLSHRTWRRKDDIYTRFPNISFVAVSNWLAHKARQSSLLRNRSVSVIPNAFSPVALHEPARRRSPEDLNILFGAARLDDPIKGLPVLLDALRILRHERPGLNITLRTFGRAKDPRAFDSSPVPVAPLGVLRSEQEVARAYASSQITVSASSFETLPGTLVEAQAYGSVPVAFNRGGQTDIVDNGVTGFLAARPDNGPLAAHSLARALSQAADLVADPFRHSETIRLMARSVRSRFAPQAVADAYIRLISSSPSL